MCGRPLEPLSIIPGGAFPSALPSALHQTLVYLLVPSTLHQTLVYHLVPSTLHQTLVYLLVPSGTF